MTPGCACATSASLDITERRAFGIITDLAKAAYVVKEKNGRRKATRSGPGPVKHLPRYSGRLWQT
jgi:hypothetical protein